MVHANDWHTAPALYALALERADREVCLEELMELYRRASEQKSGFKPLRSFGNLLRRG